MKIPVLGNLTPVEASKTEKGRAMLKEVLRQIENELARCNEKDIYPFLIEKINRRLGFHPHSYSCLHVIPFLHLHNRLIPYSSHTDLLCDAVCQHH